MRQEKCSSSKIQMNSFIFSVISVSPCLRGEGFDFIASAYSVPLHRYSADSSQPEKKISNLFSVTSLFLNIVASEILAGSKEDEFQQINKLLSAFLRASVSLCLRGGFDFHFLRLLCSSALKRCWFWLRLGCAGVNPKIALVPAESLIFSQPKAARKKSYPAKTGPPSPG